jgi:phosphoglycerate dehydrogenase-like enzyme
VLHVLLPDTIDLTLDHPLARFERYDVRAPLPERARDADVLVVWGNPTAALRDAARDLRRVRWVASLAAGPDAVLAAGFAPGVAITSGVSLHSLPVAEHTLALLLAAARRLHVLRDRQRDALWAAELGGIQPRHEPEAFRSLRQARVTIWGFGHIAAQLSGYLQALGAHVTGIARSAGVRSGVVIHDVRDVDALLPSTDALVMILPSLPETHRVLDARRLALLPRHAWLVNVGRGDTVDEAALIAALEAGTIAGAALDVFEREPLPPTSRLWQLPNVLITPHAAGGRPLGAEELLRENLEHLLAGRALRNRVA